MPDLLTRYLPFDGVRLNIAVGQRGEVAGVSGTSADVSNSVDRALLGHLRSISDVIVTSGATARAESLRPSKHAPMVVLTLANSLVGLENLSESQAAPSVTLLTEVANEAHLQEAVTGTNIAMRVAGVSDLTPTSVLAWLRAQGYSRILVEFGPTLISRWSDVGIIDEICLTETGVGEAKRGLLARGEVQLPKFVKGEFETVFSEVDVDSRSRFSQLKRL